MLQITRSRDIIKFTSNIFPSVLLKPESLLYWNWNSALNCTLYYFYHPNNLSTSFLEFSLFHYNSQSHNKKLWFLYDNHKYTHCNINSIIIPVCCSISIAPSRIIMDIKWRWSITIRWDWKRWFFLRINKAIINTAY